MFRNKRGVSEIIGYILMVAVVIVISIFVYEWLKTYVPQQSLTCPDGTSVAVDTWVYNCTLNTLSFTFDNDGTFSLAGYFIHASNDSTQQIATIDLSPYYSGPSTNLVGNGIIFNDYNVLDPGKEEGMNVNFYNFSADLPTIASGTLASIDILPIRYVEFNGKSRTTSCGNAEISIPISCS
jgi:flagellin-like protein